MMKIGLHASGAVGSSGRGFGVYTEKLFNTLKDLSSKENLSVELLDINKTSRSYIKNMFDVVHFPSFDFFFHTLPSHIPCKSAVTVHDTIPLIYPKHYPPGIRGRYNFVLQKRALKKVDAVITDSRTSEKDIVRFLNIPSKRIAPIYLGPTINSQKRVSKEVLKKYNLPTEFVLYIGDVNWNKNLLTLVSSCSDLEIHLVIVGKKAASTDFDKKHVENQPLVSLQTKYGDSPYIHRVGFVDDKDIFSVLKSAKLLCQPSYYEGFGLSVLDAMNLGVPTLCSHTQALVEIYEPATVFFNPYDVDDLKTKLQKIIADSTLRKKLTAAGIKHASKFSWQKTALETYNVYKNICA